MIEDLAYNEVFVFGSNLAGKHGGGAARQAYDRFGAQWGVGEGLTGQSYAFPTLDKDFKQLSIPKLCSAKDAFYRCVTAHPELNFLFTKVGCGIAGYPEEDMCMLFQDAPENVVLPSDWRR